MTRSFFEENGALPARVRLVFDAVDQDEMDHLAALKSSRTRRKPVVPPAPASTRRGRGKPTPSLREVLGLHTASGRALLAGALAGVLGFVAIVAFGAPFEASLGLGVVAVALAAASPRLLPALALRRALRQARRTFEVEVSPSDLVIRTGKTVLRTWQLRDVQEIRVERRRLVVESATGGIRILPIRFVSEQEVSAIVTRTRALVEAARAKRA